MEGRLGQCNSCRNSKTIVFMPLCSHMPLCALCIEHFIFKSDLFLECPDCELAMGQKEFKVAIQVSVPTIERLLGHSLGLRPEELCPRCRHVLIDKVQLRCRKHVICIPCFRELVKRCILSKIMIACPFPDCDQTPFYSLSEFEVRLRPHIIKDYADLINQKTELSQNSVALRKIRRAFNMAMYGNDLLDADPASVDFRKIPEYKATLKSLLRQMSESATSCEFKITLNYHAVLPCALSGCENKVYKFQGIELSMREFACSNRCLRIHYYELPAGVELRTKAGVLIDQSKFIDLEPVQEVKLCFLCYEKFLPNELPPRDCEHVLCWKCLKDYMEDKIGKSQVEDSEFKCPECPVPFSPSLVQKAFPSGKQFEQFLTFRFNKIKELRENEIVLQCPNEKCAKIYAIARSPSPFIQCGLCPQKICALCFKPHHPKCTCTEYEKLLRMHEESK